MYIATILLLSVNMLKNTGISHLLILWLLYIVLYNFNITLYFLVGLAWSKIRLNQITKNVIENNQTIRTIYSFEINETCANNLLYDKAHILLLSFLFWPIDFLLFYVNKYIISCYRNIIMNQD